MLQVGAAVFYQKLGQTLLQIEAALLWQIGASVVTGNRYYRMEELLQIVLKCVTNWGRYSNLGQLL